MSTPTAKTRAQELIRWMSALEEHAKFSRSGLAPIPRQPRPAHLAQLQRLQEGAEKSLESLVAVFWGEPQNERGTLVTAYLAALLTLKLLADDLCVQGLEVALHPTNPADTPDRQAAAGIESRYQRFIERWIVVSPLINPQTFKGNEQFLPKIVSGITSPILRSLNFSSPLAVDFGGAVHPLQRARTAVAQDLQRIRTSPKQTRIGANTEHLLGLVFLLAQLELKLRWTQDVTDRGGVDSWYGAASRPVETMRDDVLGVFDAALRATILTGNGEEGDRLLGARHLLTISMSTRYSLRRQETRVLLTFFEKQNKTGRFAFQDDVVGVNKVEEQLFSYVGRNDPDSQDNREALSVSSVRTRQAQLAGARVKVFGLIDAGKTRLEDELTSERIALDVTISVAGFTGTRRDRRVIVDGELNTGTGALRITVASIIPHSEGYRALVSFPLRHAQTNQQGELELTPGWRGMTDTLKRADAREREEQKEGVFSVPETLTLQRELITDLLRDQAVRNAVPAALKRRPIDLDLLDRNERGKVWAALFVPQRTHVQSMKVLNGYLQHYLNLFTRHTYFNLRDSGTPYLSSDWPTDLTGRHFRDCGVYAVETAYDLFRAVNGVSGLTLEFQFLTFLNHLCMIVTFGDHSFLVNNSEIAQPRKIAAAGTTPTKDERVGDAFLWGGQAFTTVYDVTYIMFLAVLPTLSLDTRRADAAFKRDIWKMYENSQGWGISNDATIARQYFEGIQLFNTGSVKLANLIVELRGKEKESAQAWAAATQMALDLYTLAERMAERANFVFFNKGFTDAKPVPAVGFAIRPDPVTRRTGVTTLPMYELAEMLEQRRRASRRLTADQTALTKRTRGMAHAIELTNRFRKP